jgi:hypothetical protein
MRKLAFLSALCALMSGSGAQAMSYGLVPFQDGTTAIVARGAIDGNESARLLSFLEEASASGGVPRTLVISSPGGNMVSALRLGLTLRQLGIRTVVGSIGQDAFGQSSLGAGQCHSACVLVLMAGVNRVVMPGSRVGVHSPQVLLVSQGRAYRVNGAITRTMVQGTEPVLRSYARHMGVSPAVIDVAHRVPHTGIRTLSSSELAQYGLVTYGSGRRMAPAASPRRAAAAARRVARSRS